MGKQKKFLGRFWLATELTETMQTRQISAFNILTVYLTKWGDPKSSLLYVQVLCGRKAVLQFLMNLIIIIIIVIITFIPITRYNKHQIINLISYFTHIIKYLLLMYLLYLLYFNLNWNKGDPQTELLPRIPLT